MNPIELYRKKDEDYEQVAYYCSECGRMYIHKEDAEKCCKPIICEKCGKEINRCDKKGNIEAYYINPTRCSACYRQDKWNAMETITEEEYNKLCKEDDSFGPVFWGDTGYSDLYEALECELGDYEKLEDVSDEIELGQWQKMDKIDIRNIIYNEIDNINFEDDVDANQVYKDVNELFDFVDKWNEKQTSYIYYTGINKKLKISQETLKEYWEGSND